MLKNCLQRRMLRDVGVALAFACSIAVLLLSAAYAITRISSERALKEKLRAYSARGWE